MGSIMDFLGSPLGHLLIIIIIIVIILIVIGPALFGRPIGAVIMEAMGKRPIKLDEIDAHAHERIVDESKDATIISKDKNAQWLCIRSGDDIHYQSQRGLKYLGKIRGQATYQSRIEVQFRRPWHFKKYLFIAPPEMLVSSPSSKQVTFEGISVKMCQNDFCYPCPSQGFKFSENDLDNFAMRTYEARNLIMSNTTLNPMGATMLLRSASDTEEVRMEMERMKHHIFRSETDQPINQPPPQSSGGGFIE
jgi:hypothetical protein